MLPTFEIYKDKAGEWRFRLKAKNGQVVAVGEGYTTRQNAVVGAEGIADMLRDNSVCIRTKRWH